MDGATPQGTPGGPPDYAAYEPLTVETAAARVAAYPGLPERLGGGPAGWSVREVGDGNLNYVYILEGPAGSVCVKQALPYVRLVGESWPLPLSRSFFEAEALARQARTGGAVPALIHVDGPQALVVMENLGSHVIWRRALIERRRHEAGPVLGRFMAETLFRSSDLALPAEARRGEAALFSGNVALMKITEDLVFTDPYREHELNDWTTPELDEDVARVQSDSEWKTAVQGLKHDFLTRAEALVHGDLHTGSVMVSDDGDVRVIDPEFAFYGPMGFDVGALLANLWLNAFAQDGHGPGAAEYQGWLMGQARGTWDAFAARFAELWEAERTGDAWPRALFEDQGQPSHAARDAFLARVQRDALGFAGAKMTRRILGIAGVADLQSVEPPAVRAACERRALRLARALIVERAEIGTVAAACERAGAILAEAEEGAVA